MSFERPRILTRLLPIFLIFVLTISALLHVESEPLIEFQEDEQEKPSPPSETLSVAPATLSVVQVVLDIEFPLLQIIERNEDGNSKLCYTHQGSDKLLKYSRILFRLIISPNGP